jgi:hypothetical protein
MKKYIKYIKSIIHNYQCLHLEERTMTPYKLPRKDPTLYGEYTWFVKSKIAKRGRVYVSADSVTIDHGALVFTGSDQATSNGSLVPMDDDLPRNPEKTTFIIAAGHWQAAYLTSCGHAASVLMWDNEVDRYHG